jgi:hypothetical protein
LYVKVYRGIEVKLDTFLTLNVAADRVVSFMIWLFFPRHPVGKRLGGLQS